jgi:hypothetical protein
MLFPYYNEEILHLQYKAIEYLNENTIFETNSRKRKRFNLFIENLIQKNNDLLEKIRMQEEEDNNINNYEKVDTEKDIVNEEELTDSSSLELDDEQRSNYSQENESDDKKIQ